MTDEVRTTSSTGAEKGMKPARFDLIPVPALTKIAELYGKGAEKYAEHNWRAGYDWSKSYAALQRHATQFWAGEDIDEEMGLPHMAAVAFHAMALLTFMEEHPEFDDRYLPRQKSTPETLMRLHDSLYSKGVVPNPAPHCVDCGHLKTSHNSHLVCDICTCQCYKGSDE